MNTVLSKIPPSAVQTYQPSQNLLEWMAGEFDRLGDIYRASIYGTDAYVVRSPIYAQHVLRDNWRNYVKGQAIKRVALLLGNGLMVSQGEVWKGQRRMIQPAFHAKAIQSLTSVMREANLELLTDWENSARRNEFVNVTEDTSRMVLKITLRAIFGDDYDRIAQPFKVLSEDAARSLEFAQTFRELGKTVLQVISERRATDVAAADMLGMLMHARHPETGEGMADRQLVNEILTLVVAGHETTASTLNWVWYLLSRHPEVQERLSRELDQYNASNGLSLEELPKFAYTRYVIDEALRLYPAGWLVTRRALNNDYLEDYFVPRGTEIYIPIYFIQRHPDHWAEPDRFNPDRFAPECVSKRHPLAMLPFSAGPRNCIGEMFARVEMQIHLMMIAKRIRLDYIDPATPEIDPGVNLRSKGDFMMKPQIKTVD